MVVNGTIHKRNFDGTERWYFVEELSADVFIGYAVPNDDYIEENGKVVIDSEVKDWFEENLVVNGEVQWYYPNPNCPDIRDWHHLNIKKGFWDEV